MVERTYPFGVIVIAVVYLVSAASAVWQSDIPERGVEVFLDRAGYFELAWVLYSLVGLVLAVGLLRLRPWAWTATMLWAGVSMTTALVAYVQGEPRYVVMLLSVVAVFYLNSRDVRAVFHPETLREDHPRER